MVALVVLGVFGVVLVILTMTRRPSEPDAVTREVIKQALTGPVALPPAHTRLPGPNSQDGEEDEAA